MRAFLLSAGLGTRLRPITDTIPKCLVSFNGHPLLDWWAKLFLECGVDEVLINTHHLRGKVQKYIQDFNANNEEIKFIEVYESELLGSGGTVKANQNFIKDDENFLICYADNLCNANLKKLIEFHEKNNSVLSMALFRTNNPSGCGITELDNTGKIRSFIEKPKEPKDNLANAGIYVANKKIYDYFPENSFIDFGKDVLPKLTGMMHGLEITDYLIDIGTMENCKKAEAEWTYDYYKDTLTC